MYYIKARLRLSTNICITHALKDMKIGKETGKIQRPANPII